MGQHREQPRAVPRLTVLGIAERLLAGAAVVGATIYVLINGLYIEFYDDFGVRPEDVGLDRLAILGRSAWVALVAIALVGWSDTSTPWPAPRPASERPGPVPRPTPSMVAEACPSSSGSAGW
jgi:hypothetical protein